MQKVFFISLTFICILTILLLTGCENNLETRTCDESDYQAMKSLSRSLSYKKIVEEYSNCDWDKQEDPAMLMLFSNALVESGIDYQSVLNTSRYPDYIIGFISAYTGFLNGKLANAANILGSLDDNGGDIFSAVGILEMLLYTEHISEMENPISILKVLKAEKPSWIIPYYSSWYYYYSGDFKRVMKMLNTQKDALEPETYWYLKALLLIQNNNLDEVEELLKRQSNELMPWDTIELEAYIIRLKYGRDKSLEYLERRTNQFPDMWYIKYLYAQSLIEAEEFEQGLNLLKELSRKRPHDLYIKLFLAENLMLNSEKDTDYQNALRILNKEKNFRQLPYYHILIARMLLYDEEYERSDKHYRLAKSVFPKGDYVLWFEYDRAIKKHDYSAAEAAIKDLISHDPNDVNTLIASIELSFLQNDLEALLETEKVLMASKRYVSDKETDEITSYKVLAYATKGNFSKTRSLLVDIKDPGICSTTLEKINEMDLKN